MYKQIYLLQYIVPTELENDFEINFINIKSLAGQFQRYDKYGISVHW